MYENEALLSLYEGKEFTHKNFSIKSEEPKV
jgi:hypothetical protein